jgi:hypothetical protein
MAGFQPSGAPMMPDASLEAQIMDRLTFNRLHLPDASIGLQGWTKSTNAGQI